MVFAEDTTPFLTDISPQFGSILGGEIITFTGERFSDTAPTSITIDGIECVVISQTTTELQCQLGEFLDYDLKVDDPNVDNDGCGYGSSIVVIDVDGMGYAANNGQCFFYVKKWSDPETWGDDIPPQEGDSVHIPSGCNVLFDIPASPILNLVNIEGGLIFLPVENESDPNYDRYFSAHNIMVRNGFLQAGTKEFPYTSKLTITLYGEEYDPYIPLYGNKVLAIRYSRLDMHGQERVRTWTDLKFTANAGESLIILNDMNGDDLDWQVGEEIVIASTDYEGRNSEKKVITSISATTTNPVIGLDSPLDFTHFAETVILGSDPDDFIDMRAEVGLLSRNIVF